MNSNLANDNNSVFNSKRLLNKDDLQTLGINYSRMHLSRLMKAGKFPCSIALGQGKGSRKAWRAAEIYSWLDSR